MAEKLTGADGGAVHDDEAHDGQLVNSGARADAIRNGFAEIHAIEQDIARLTEQHIASLKKARTKAWRDLKAAVDIPRKRLEPQYKMYKMAAESRFADSEDDGDKVLDDLREAHLALHPGGQLDWVAAVTGDYGHAEAAA